MFSQTCYGCNPPTVWRKIFRHWRFYKQHQIVHNQYLLDQQEQQQLVHANFVVDNEEHNYDLDDNIADIGHQNDEIVAAVNVEIAHPVVLEEEPEIPAYGPVEENNPIFFNGPDAEATYD